MEVQAIPNPSIPAELAAGVDYFFAVLPDDRARTGIAAAAERFRKALRVSGTAVAVDGLHLSLCPMGRPERLRLPLEQALLAAATEVRGSGFAVTLDSAMRFTARNGQFPFVLCADHDSTEAALKVRKAIAAAQLRMGLQVGGVSSFLPHVELRHGPAIDAIEESITPIRWQAREFVLIRCFFGQSRQEVIGRWPLASEPEPEPIDLLAELANMPELPRLPDEE